MTRKAYSSLSTLEKRAQEGAPFIERNASDASHVRQRRYSEMGVAWQITQIFKLHKFLVVQVQHESWCVLTEGRLHSWQCSSPASVHT
jgi:hypothetical protein